MSKKILKNVRINPINGEPDFYFPMEVTNPADKEYARLNGLEIGMAMLGNRRFLAIMIPCKRKGYDDKGREIYLDTPSEEQYRTYKALIKDKLNRQEDEKQDGRCNIPTANGGTRRCPLRIPNPDYIPGGNQPKTIANRCEGCPYEPFRQGHTVIELSCLDHECENGEKEPYEAPSPKNYYAADRYEELSKEFVDFVRERKPRLAPLAEMLVREYKLTEASEELGRSTSTTFSQKEKLQELLTEFLDIAITL
jgi:hypothetical protein